ncbi:hypothetical protein MA16_Dca015645 [Dendrobium catenatum]|uniref:Uncharacterized protein n=1 Tax=Dendrobium catenatum TaxID=906689 RepID=A0A2I0VXK9_9ASPA|nr:hypothetical protein MA16_Dca015645 [Dendrobium catenatum]
MVVHSCWPLMGSNMKDRKVTDYGKPITGAAEGPKGNFTLDVKEAQRRIARGMLMINENGEISKFSYKKFAENDASCSGMNIFVQRFGNSNAIPGNSALNVNSLSFENKNVTRNVNKEDDCLNVKLPEDNGNTTDQMFDKLTEKNTKNPNPENAWTKKSYIKIKLNEEENMMTDDGKAVKMIVELEVRNAAILDKEQPIIEKNKHDEEGREIFSKDTKEGSVAVLSKSPVSSCSKISNSGNKFDILSSVPENLVNEDLLVSVKEKENAKKSGDGSKRRLIKDENGEKILSDNKMGGDKISIGDSNKIKLAKELKSLGPIKNITRGRNFDGGGSKRKEGGASPMFF